MRAGAVVSDLLLYSRIEAAATSAGADLVRVDDPRELPVELDLVLVDWSARRPGWPEALRGRAGRVILFGPHVDLEAHADARAAELGPMMARSKLVAELAELLGQPSDAHRLASTPRTAPRGRRDVARGLRDHATVTTSETAPQPPVLIFGAHIAALGVLRTLAGHGVECYVADETADVITRSRWYRAPERKLAETPDSSELAKYLETLDLPHAILIACSDRWTQAVAGLPAATRARFPASVPSREVVDYFVEKDRFTPLVARLGIPHAHSIRIDGPADLDLATDEDLANGFLKPNSSQLHRRVFGTKGSFVPSREAAVRLVERAAAEGITFVVQEWIPGDLSTTVLLDGFVDGEGTVRAMMARRRIRVSPPRLGNTVSAVTIPLADVDPAVASLRKLLAEVGYRGAFNAEFKFDARDGQFKIIEVNARPAWFIGTIAQIGMDVPWMIYRDAQELPVESAPPYAIGRYTIYEFQDALALFRYLKSFRRPEGSLLGPWLSGDRALFWWRDAGPAVGGVGHALWKRVNRTFEWARRAPRGAS